MRAVVGTREAAWRTTGRAGSTLSADFGAGAIDVVVDFTVLLETVFMGAVSAGAGVLAAGAGTGAGLAGTVECIPDVATSAPPTRTTTAIGAMIIHGDALDFLLMRL